MIFSRDNVFTFLEGKKHAIWKKEETEEREEDNIGGKEDIDPMEMKYKANSKVT